MALSPCRYQFNDDGSFEIHDYHASKPFSSFLPGVAGLWGIPLWLYYVNRGQVVSCFGTQDKDHGIMEFQSAALHQRRVATEGFRTFIKYSHAHSGSEQQGCYEPFRALQEHYKVSNKLVITSAELRIEEINYTLGLKVTVRYNTVPSDNFGALSRQLEVERLSDAAGELKLEVLDGFPKVQPYGEAIYFLWAMPFITEGYLHVTGLEQNRPFYNLQAKPSDTSETEFVESGNFYLAASKLGGRRELLRVIADPELVFGDSLDLIHPYGFIDDEFDGYAHQAPYCTTACAFSYLPQLSLNPGESLQIDSMAGMANTFEDTEAICNKLLSEGYLGEKAEQNRELVEQLKQGMFIHSGNKLFDQYVGQTFLDNLLRGGLPITLKGKEKQSVFYVYSRKHGDLERDYNFFKLDATYFSEGNGNYRDVNQNRRNDLHFNTDVGSANLEYFFNLSQLDGYNPLVCMGSRFAINDKTALQALLDQHFAAANHAELLPFFDKPFTPGSLFKLLESLGLQVDPEALLQGVIDISDKFEDAEHDAGYWSDHWYYNFDLLESFIAIFPDQVEALLHDKRSFTYWDEAVVVKARAQKYVLNDKGEVRHLLSTGSDEEKAALIASRSYRPHHMRTEHGRGDIYHTSLLEKIVCLLTNKIATLSPSGIGMDMDGGRPGWHDSINGLPSMFGASTSEVANMVRALRMLLPWLRDQALAVPLELHRYVLRIDTLLQASLDNGLSDFDYWDQSGDAKEQFRAETQLGISGELSELNFTQLKGYLERVLAKAEQSMAKAEQLHHGVPLTYVAHKAEEYVELSDAQGQPLFNERGQRCVQVNRFSLEPMPLFLEAASHTMRYQQDVNKARERYLALKETCLYDRALRKYILGDDVRNYPEIGRIWAWAPGWFENENIFMHAAHKYYLGLLSAGLYDEFFQEMQDGWVPFQDPEVYGRSPLENVSFIVSSRHPRHKYHGRGMLPKSSGTTAEIVHMLLWMSFGKHPFSLGVNGLKLCFAPVLADWCLSRESSVQRIRLLSGEDRSLVLPELSYSCVFLGHTPVIYQASKRQATFGKEALQVSGYRVQWRDGQQMQFGPEGIGAPFSEQIRQGEAELISVDLS